MYSERLAPIYSSNIKKITAKTKHGIQGPETPDLGQAQKKCGEVKELQRDHKPPWSLWKKNITQLNTPKNQFNKVRVPCYNGIKETEYKLHICTN